MKEIFIQSFIEMPNKDSINFRLNYNKKKSIEEKKIFANRLIELITR